MGAAGVLDPQSQNYGPLAGLSGKFQLASFRADHEQPEVGLNVRVADRPPTGLLCVHKGVCRCGPTRLSPGSEYEG